MNNGIDGEALTTLIFWLILIKVFGNAMGW